MTKYLHAIAVFAIALIWGVTAAQSASAATSGNIVYNRYNSTGYVYVSGGSSYVRLSPDWDSLHVGIQHVQCFYPTKTAYSQWGGRYDAYVVRCFQTNNNFLNLKVG